MTHKLSVIIDESSSWKPILELTCETNDENRDNIQWIFNGRYVVDGDFDQDFKINKNILKIKNIQLYHTGQYECSGMDKLLWLRIRVIESTRTSGSGRCSTGRYQNRKLDDLLTVHFWPDSWKLSNKKTVFLLPQLTWTLFNHLKSL